MASLLLSLVLALYTLSLVFATSPAPTPTPNVCGDTCRFRLCHRVDRSLLPIGSPVIINGAAFPIVCSADPILGSLVDVNTGKPLIRVGGTFRNLRNELKSRGLGDVGEKAFTDVALLALSSKFRSYGFKGITSNFTVHQYNTLKDECIALPIVSLCTVYHDPVRRVPCLRLNDPLRNCLSPRAHTPKVHVEWIWFHQYGFAGYNFDLEVAEPNGETVNNRNPQSTNGRFLGDIGRNGCGRLYFARESVVYDEIADSGKYTINVKTSGRCRRPIGPRDPGLYPFDLYLLRVFKDGQQVFNKFGRAKGRRYSDSFTFTI